MKNLKISKEINLPLDIVTETIAILAKRRVGKSYTMRKIWEELLAAKQQVVVIDPKGDQWGIRSSADGKKAGFPIVILGGEHGDAPLEVNSGEIVAKLAVEERVSMLIDLSSFRKHEIATFMSIFLENLYRLKAQERYRTPVMLIIDEADAIAPQRPQKGEERMLGAAEDIVRRGGQRGIGCTLVTQRSAVLNKNVLTQAQILVALRTIAPQDLNAMKAWIDVHGSEEEAAELMGSLPSLPIGDAWFWSPGWPTAGGIFTRTHILPITTFDSAATPKAGEKKVMPKSLADVDMEALKKQMAATIEKAKAEDPKLLKKRITELEAEMNKLKKFPMVSAPDTADVTKKIKAAIGANNKEWEKIIGSWRAYAEKVEKYYRDLVHEGQRHFDMIDAHKPVVDHPELIPIFYPGEKIKTSPIKIIPIPKAPDLSKVKIEYHQAPTNEGEQGKMYEGEKKILIAISQFPDGVTRKHLTVLTGYKKDTRNRYIQRLVAQGLAQADGQDLLFVTQAGKDALGNNIQELPTGSELRHHLLQTLHKGERDILAALQDAYPDGLSREQISEATGYKKDTRNRYIQKMNARQIIEVEGDLIKISDKLYD